MLHYLTLKNFRAFKEQRFNFSRINIFVGPNNSGKSSALSAINLIAQTLNENEAAVPLLLRGKFDDLGTFLDVVNGNNARTSLGLEIGMNKFSYKYEFKYSIQRREIDVRSFEIMRDGQSIYKYTQHKSTFSIKYYGKAQEKLFPKAIKRKPFFYGLRCTDRIVRGIRFQPKKHSEVFTDITDDMYQKLQVLETEMSRSRGQLNNIFSNYDTISPFRDPPTRTFLFSGIVPASIGRTGANTIDMLVSDNFQRGRNKVGLVDSVSEWFETTGMGRGIKVKPLTSRHYEICLIGHDGKDHNLCDVGFGCSQVLPVLIGALNLAGSKNDSEDPRGNAPLFLAQEPEIHLHPNAQAELGSFFARLFKERGQLFVETHSPDLILRMQRHVAEGLIKAEDVKVFYVHGGKSSKVTELKMNSAGMFKKRWPAGFFPQRQRESFALAQASSASVGKHKK